MQAELDHNMHEWQCEVTARLEAEARVQQLTEQLQHSQAAEAAASKALQAGCKAHEALLQQAAAQRRRCNNVANLEVCSCIMP